MALARRRGHRAAMRLVAACKLCRAAVIAADGLGNQAGEHMREHLRARHPDRDLPAGLRLAEVLRWFDVYRTHAESSVVG